MSLVDTVMAESSTKCSRPGSSWTPFLLIWGNSEGCPIKTLKASYSWSTVPKDTVLEWRSRVSLKPMFRPSIDLTASVSDSPCKSLISLPYSDSLRLSTVLMAQHMPISVGTLLNSREQLTLTPASWQESSKCSLSSEKHGSVDSHKMLNTSG